MTYWTRPIHRAPRREEEARCQRLTNAKHRCGHHDGDHNPESGECSKCECRSFLHPDLAPVAFSLPGFANELLGNLHALGVVGPPSDPSAAPPNGSAGTSTPTARDSMVARPSAPPADRPSADLSEDDAPEQPEPPCAECEDGWVYTEEPGHLRCIAKSRCEKCNALED